MEWARLGAEVVGWITIGLGMITLALILLGHRARRRRGLQWPEPTHCPHGVVPRDCQLCVEQARQEYLRARGAPE